MNNSAFGRRLQVKPELKGCKLNKTTVLWRQLSLLWKIVGVEPASVGPNAAQHVGARRYERRKEAAVELPGRFDIVKTNR